MLKNNKGFTLIELLVVIIILGILAGLAVPKVSEMIKGSKVNAVYANANVVIRIVKQIYAETGSMPANDAAINTKLPSTFVLGTAAGNSGMTYTLIAGGTTFTLRQKVDMAGLGTSDNTTTIFNKTLGGQPTAVTPVGTQASSVEWTPIDAIN